jgi:thiamine biosynthesis lipoprotein
MDVLISPRRRAFMGALGAASLLSACGRTAAPGTLPVIELGGFTMGSVYTVKITGRRLPQSLQSAAGEAVAVALGKVDSAMSTHSPQSELSLFNARPAHSPFPLSPDLFSVFALAREVSGSTGGAFDVTVGPAVDAWGFGPGRRARIVDNLEVAALERRVGWKMLRLDDKGGTITKDHDQVRADLSGIAKGYGVDKAAQALDALGVEHYLIEAGGEVRTRGLNAQERPWQVAIEQPTAGPRRPRYLVPLTGLAMATSGDYRIFFEGGGRHYSHEIDPATARPIDNRLTSVSVVAATGALADALGKLIVLGPGKAYARAVSLGVAAHFIVREPDGTLSDLSTPAFTALGGKLLHA